MTDEDTPCCGLPPVSELVKRLRAHSMKTPLGSGVRELLIEAAERLAALQAPPEHRGYFAAVTRVGFDSMENHTPHVHSLAAVFVGHDRAAGEAEATAWMDEQKRSQPAEPGYDREWYPQWYVQTGEVGATLTGTRRLYT